MDRLIKTARRTVFHVGPILIALSILYPLSAGPEYCFAKRMKINDAWITPLYAPLGAVFRLWEPLDDAANRYFLFWADLADDTPPEDLGNF
jgi:hypothetical protein